MERARVSWTDERLDDLQRTVESGFRRLDSRIDSEASRMDEGFRSVNARIDAMAGRMEEGFQLVNARIDSLNRTMIQFGGGLSVGLLAMIVTLIAQG